MLVVGIFETNCSTVVFWMLGDFSNWNLLNCKYPRNAEGLFLGTNMLIYGNFIYLKKWKISSGKIVKLTFRFIVVVNTFKIMALMN